MHSQQQQQQQQPPPSQSLLQSQHHNQQQQQHHHNHHHHHHPQLTLPPQQNQQQPPPQSQIHSQTSHAEQPHYHPQTHHHSHIDHSHGQHHVNQSQSTHPQHRQQHQQHPQQHQHQQPHHQQSHHHAHHHQMPPTQPHHHMAHHGIPQMIPYAQNIMYPPQSMGHHAFPAGHIGPNTFNPAQATNHRPETINVNSQPPQAQAQPQPQSLTQAQTQPQSQPQQQPPLKQQQQPLVQHPQPAGSMNPNNMSHIGQIPPPVINTSVGNTSGHPMGNGPMMDSHMQNRMPMPPQWPHHFLPHTYNMPPHMMPFPIHQNYPGVPITAPNPAIMTPRLPLDMGVRPTFDPQNHTGPLAAKVPISQAQPIIAKPPNAIPTAVPGMMPPPPTAAVAPVKSRERKPLAIVDPKTKHVFTVDELKGSTSKSSTQVSDTLATTTQAAETANVVSSTAETPTTTTTTVVTVPEEVKTVPSSQKSVPEIKTTTDAPQTIAKKPATSSENHGHNLTRDVSPPTPSITSLKAPLLDDKRQATKEQFTTPNAIEEPSASALTGSMQALTISAARNGGPDTVIKNSVQADTNDVRILKTDEVDRAVPLKEEGDTKEHDIVSVSGKGDNHVDAEPNGKKLNPDLPYVEGQYSPLNPTGYRKYSIEFLKAVGRSMQLPEEREVTDFFVPDYLQGGLRGDAYNMPRRSSQQTLNNKQPARKIIATQSLQPEIAFKTVENPWKPELEKEKAKAGEIDTQRLLKVFRGLLNKITPQKYDSIVEKIEALDLEGDDRLKSVIDLVFDKAVDEPGFCELYARISKVIATRNSQFNHHLLKKCQDEFETSDLYSGLNVEAREQDIESETDPTKKKFLEDELYEDMRLRRKKYLGTIKLIGEMYKLDLLVPKIIGFCIAKLLHEVSNENLECLCSLIATVGAKMASEKEDVRQSLKNTINVLNEFANNKRTNELFTLESRIRFKILDTIDLSRKNWKPRSSDDKKPPNYPKEYQKDYPKDYPRGNMKNNDANIPPRRNVQNQSFTRR